jgi:hypothetical protein
MKNTKVQLLKKGFNSICQKLKRKTGKIIEPTNEKQHDYYSIKSIKCNESSSGYASGGSEEIYEHHNNELKDVDTHLLKTNNKTKIDLIKYLLDHEIIYINSIQNGLENFIRPLMAVIDNKLYFQIFQNIEKINSMSKFIQSKIIESYNVNGDFVESTIDVIYEYVSIFLLLFL